MFILLWRTILLLLGSFVPRSPGASLGPLSCQGSLAGMALGSRGVEVVVVRVRVGLLLDGVDVVGGHVLVIMPSQNESAQVSVS